MVGFGSSLRMARRSGWEGAYLDYESLKLLLSQIEAVYEEEGHRQRRDGEAEVFIGVGENDTDDVIQGKHKSRRAKDYRDELFLESDSSNAFHSLGSLEDAADQQTTSEESSCDNLGDSRGRDQLDPMFASVGDSTSGVRHGADGGNVLGHHGHAHGGRDRQMNNNVGYNSMMMTTPGRHKQFSLSYSHEPTSSSEDDDDESQNNYCQDGVIAGGPSNWFPWKVKSRENVSASPSAMMDSSSRRQRKNKSKKSKNHYRHKRGRLLEDDQEFFVSGELGGSSDEFLRGGDGDGEVNVGSSPNPTSITTSLLNAPFRRTKDVNFVSNENSSLLMQSTPSNQQVSSLYGLTTGQTGSTTPLQESHRSSTTQTLSHSHRPLRDVGYVGLGVTSEASYYNDYATTPHNQHQFVSPVNTTSVVKPTKWEIERKLERKRRRKRKRRLTNKRRKQMERKVPRHIRVAHSKARAITERFLGLLRAETEKVMLFAQSRLGELADTVGSLRFPTIDEGTEFGSTGVQGNSDHHAQSSYVYSYSESGGFHPSASSSSDEGRAAARWQRMFPWPSDTSDDSCASSTGGAPIRRSFSGGGLSVLTQQRANLSSHHDRGKSGVSIIGGRHTTDSQRHIQHFEELRRQRPIFQRNDHIVGEDLLLISAVDEADGYTAVGVELMHVLRYICVNLIAVRKICRKHDRLLMNRMLGGYYHRTRRAKSPNKAKNGQDRQKENNVHTQDAQVLGALLARASGDVFEAHPYLIGQMNDDKLVGLYDVKIQQLANSRTVQVISSCLALALSEYEVSRSRADALARLNSSSSVTSPPRNIVRTVETTANSGNIQTYTSSSYFPIRNMDRRRKHREQEQRHDLNHPLALLSDDENENGPPSTASGVSLARLRFTITSIVALREAARTKQNAFSTYISRSMLLFTGQAVVGEGLDGCSRETLDFLVSYNPDAALLLDPSVLHDGFKYGLWSRLSIGAVMASSLAVALAPVTSNSNSTKECWYRQEQAVLNALSIFPRSKDLLLQGNENDFIEGESKIITPIILDDEVFLPITYRLSRISCLLYTMNYYVVHPTAKTFLNQLGAEVGHSAAIIGAPCLSAILIAMLHCFVLSRDAAATHNRSRYSIECFRCLFFVSSLAALVGNAIHALAVMKDSIPLAILGRFIIGLGSTEILHRQMISYCLPVSQVVLESARLMQFHIIGLICGLLIGSLASSVPIVFIGYGVGYSLDSLQFASWMMCCFWLLQSFLMLFLFKGPHYGKTARRRGKKNSKEGGGSGSDSSASDPMMTVNRVSPNPAGIYNHGGMPENTNHNNRNEDGHHHHSNDDLFGKAANPDEEERLLHDSDNNSNNKLLESPQPTLTPSIETTVDSGVSCDRRKEERSRSRKNNSAYRVMKIFVIRLRKLLSYNVALPVSLTIIVYVRFAQEALFTSCPIIVGRYFSWSGTYAGLFLGVLTMMILPINYICQKISGKYEERTVVKRSILILGLGLMLMVNFGSLASLAFHVHDLFNETSSINHKHFYDCFFGVFQYVIGLTISFIGLTSLEGATFCLVSKLSPPCIEGVIDVGTIVGILSLLARLFGDVQILMVELSHRLINTDIVNALIIPLFVISILAGYFVRKHFFFLM